MSDVCVRQRRATLDECRRDGREAEETEKREKCRGGLIDWIEYKRLREKEEEETTRRRKPSLYMRTHTHTHASHIRTRTHFSHTTEPKTDEPSNVEAFQNDAPSQPV